MMDWTIFLTLIGEVFLLSYLDKSLYSTWVTPFILLAVPYTIVLTITFLLGSTFGFIPLYVESVLVWVVGLFVFWFGGLPILLTISKFFRAQEKTRDTFLYEERSLKVTIILAWLSIPVIIYHAFNSVMSVGGLAGIGDENFEIIYGGGLGAHLLVLCTLLSVFLIGSLQLTNSSSLKNRKVILLTLLIFFVLIILRQVKYSVVLPLIAGIIYRFITGRSKLSFVVVVKLIFIIYVFFNIVYFIGFSTLDDAAVFNVRYYEYMMRHFLSYIIGGPLTLGEMIREGAHNIHISPQAIFTPFITLYEFVTSNKIDSSSTGDGYNAIISVDGLKESNVYTLLGLVFFGLGPLGAILYILSLGFFSYLLFAIAMLTKNCWVVVMWSFIGAMLVLSWFGSYFTLLISIEAPVYCIILAFLLWLLGKPKLIVT